MRREIEATGVVMPMKSDEQRQVTRLAEGHEHRRHINRAKAKVQRGQTIKVDGRTGKVIGVYDSFIVVEFTVSCILWPARYDRYRECFLWGDVAGLL